MKRRILLGSSVVIGTTLLCRPTLSAALRSSSSASSNTLPIPDLMEVSGQTRGELTAAESTHAFSPDIKSPTLGYGQSYLGPVIRVKRGFTARMAITN